MLSICLRFGMFVLLMLVCRGCCGCFPCVSWEVCTTLNKSEYGIVCLCAGTFVLLQFECWSVVVVVVAVVLFMYVCLSA